MQLALGPVKVSLGESKRNGKKPATDEIGAPGTIVISGKLTEKDYNADLCGDKAIKVYDKMRRSDGQVKATLLVCELPLRSATWSVEPASDSPQDKEIAEFIEDNLKEQMTITWDSFLKHTLLMLAFGFSVFEKVYEIVDDKVRWHKLAPRLPKTLYSWNLDKATGGLEGITQFVWKNDQYAFLSIPAEKLLVFTHDKEGSNFEGISLLRAAYKHWYYKDHLYRIDAISSARHALGVPVLKHPSEADATEKERLDNIGEHLNAHEKMYVRLSQDYDFSIQGLSGSIKDLMPSIEHHDRMIARSILADFISLGSTDVGSFALSRDKSSFFLMALRSICNNICDTVNRYGIPQLVDYNWNVEAYPKLTVSGLETRDMEKYAKAIVDLANAGQITQGPEIEDTLRDMLHLPPKPEDEDIEQSERHYYFKEAKRKRELTYAETFVAFDEISKVLDSGEEKFIKATKDIIEKQINNLALVAVRAIATKDLGKLEDIEVRYKQQMASKMHGVLEDMFNYGRLQVKKELVAQSHVEYREVPKPLGPEEAGLVQEFLKTRSKASATVMANKLKSFITFEALRQLKKGIADKEELRKGLKGLSDRELIASAQYSVNEAFNFGRGAQAEAEKDSIASCQYSAIMDSNTCSNCERLDGEEWDYNDERTARYASGNPDCEGGTKCRCVLVYIAKSERRGR